MSFLRSVSIGGLAKVHVVTNRCGMEWDRVRLQGLEQRVYRVWRVLPDNTPFALAEQAARDLAEADIRMVDGDEIENVAHEMSKMLVDALRSNFMIELYRAAIRLFTMRTTLYLDLNFCFREHDLMGGELIWVLLEEVCAARAWKADDGDLDRRGTRWLGSC
jgi:hypothetical protein